jgi:hypothetical protein
MAYHETSLEAPRPQITIDGESYDIDYFGMDDGWSDDADDAFRFIFQLGQGLMIYLYVIQAGGLRDHRHFFHTFWLKDCAVAEVEMEDRGPPKRVACNPTVLPLLYGRVAVGDREHAIAKQTFVADFTAGGEERSVMTFELEGGGRLEWDRVTGWQVASDGGPPRPLAPEDRLRFSR